MPDVSVILPVYNSALYLRGAIDSLLRQTLRDFELLVIDDGSTDDSMRMLHACDDPRIRIIQNPGNMGIPATLNRGLVLARGRYIARMDADDECLPERLALQSAYLDAHSDVGLLGSRVGYLGAWRHTVDERLLDPGACAAYLLFGTPVAHPSVMMRKAVLERHGLSYDESFPSAQDYELWSRMADVCRVANLPRVLLRYRMHEANISTRAMTATHQRVQQLTVRQLSRLGLKPTEAELNMHRRATEARRPETSAELTSTGEWLGVIREANASVGLYDPSGLDRALAFVWSRLIMNCGNLGFAANKIATSVEFAGAWRPRRGRRVRFGLSMTYHQARHWVARRRGGPG